MHITIFSEVTIDGKLTIEKDTSSKLLFDYLGMEDIEYVHAYRNMVDGILVGMNTVRRDNPSLTCRYGKERKNPLRIIPTCSFDIPKDAVVLTDEFPTVFVTTEGHADAIASVEARPNKHCLICGRDSIDFKQMVQALEEEYQVHSLMVEGGGEVNWSFLSQDLIDRIILLQLPFIAGGRDNISVVGGEGSKGISDLKHFKLVDYKAHEKCFVMQFERKK